MPNWLKIICIFGYIFLGYFLAQLLNYILDDENFIEGITAVIFIIFWPILSLALIAISPFIGIKKMFDKLNVRREHEQK